MNWRLVGGVVIVGFGLGFVAPMMDSDLHAVLSVVSYVALYFAVREKQTSASRFLKR